MSETGIGASVRRKEDRRFLTGNGNYLDDMNVEGQTYAYFVRSPHAHATINSIDTSAAEASDGVVAVLTGQQLADDGIGGLICGWVIHSKDGEPHKAPAHLPLPSIKFVMSAITSLLSLLRRRRRPEMPAKKLTLTMACFPLPQSLRPQPKRRPHRYTTVRPEIYVMIGKSVTKQPRTKHLPMPTTSPSWNY